MLGLSAPALPWIAGYALESHDLDATRAAVRGAAGSVIEMPGNRFAVALPQALGGAAIFERPGSGAMCW